jgi:DNA mismatch repair protein MutL
MPRIQQLPPSVITKIAAGEVIERPASVVKELLENAVDAGSTRIDVEVEQGGVEVIRVVDNGCGIAADDLPLAFASHATSKLAGADDLFRIGSLGFRGEALASIGGVAQVTLQSRPADQPSGAEISCHGGQLSEARAWNGSPGTRIEVRHLFFNTPVRRRFLRAIGTELGHLSEVFTRLALSFPNLHWTLRHNGRPVYEVPASGSLNDRIRLFFGKEISDRLYEVKADAGLVRLRGYIADPVCERGNAKMQYLFVNGRWIRDRSLGHALQEAYRGLLMSGRYAVAFLFLDLPADQVDVNVHPTKVEVRFRDGNALHHLVFTAVRERLRAENLTARMQAPSTLAASHSYGVPNDRRLLADPPPWSLSSDASSSPGLPFPSSTTVGRTFPALPPESPIPTRANTIGNGMEVPATVPHPVTRSPGHPSAPSLPPPGSLKAIQLYDTYLVLETNTGMLVIDQHALHERILFEGLKERIRSGPLETQKLLIPEPVDLSDEEAARTLEHREALAELGLEVSDFGGGTVLLSSYPAILSRRSPQQVLRAVVDHLVNQDRPPTRETLLNDLLSLMACHAAVRAGDPLTPEEIAALVEQQNLADDTHHCPHGRPTALLFSKQDLEKQFRRI